LYVNASNKQYWRGKTEAKLAAGFVEEQRFLNPAEHCGDCEGFAARGRVPIGTLPPPGEDSECQTNCKCTMKYYKAGDQVSIPKQAFDSDDNNTGTGSTARIPEAADITRRDQKVIDAMGPIERETINQKYETAGVYDVNGRELFRKDGNEYSVAFSRKDAETMKGQYLTHNHPGIGASFSDHDMRIAHGQELKKIRAVGVNPRGVGTQYDFDILDDAYYAKNKGAITRAYNEARKNAMKEFQQKIKNGMPVNEANYEVTHRIMELFTSKINSGGDLVKYTRGDFR